MKTTKMMGYFAGFALVMVFLIAFSSNTFGQITITGDETAKEVAGNGGKYTHKANAEADTVDVKGKSTMLYNYGHFNTVNVSEGMFNYTGNGYWGYAGSSVGTLNVEEGRAESRGHIDTVNIGIGTGDAVFINSLTGTVGTMNLENKGKRIDVYNSAFIDTVNINGADRLNTYVSNDAGGHINTANIIGGDFRNSSTIDLVNVKDKGDVTNWSAGHIEMLNINGEGGFVVNLGDIKTANIDKGLLRNDNGSTTGTVTIGDNGRLISYKNAHIDTVYLNGGSVENVGRIDALTYTQGTYRGSQISGTVFKGPGSIGTLTVAGTMAASNGDWGIVENLDFQSDGSGLVKLAGYTSKGNTSFTGIKADHVDFAFGNIGLDLTKAITFDTDWILSFIDMNLVNDISFATLFNAEEVTNAWDLNSFFVNWGTDTNFGILDNGRFADGWGFNSDYTWFTYSEGSTITASATPEPATLVMLGLGLMSLPLARRLRKK
ncbi:MAG: PEP-CTERM sorting domain-containing protein [Planctomycetaceae bacterium]|nr:PEP-CTERM sorting domain-containing protein [Planctomycetaceae bacterium]